MKEQFLTSSVQRERDYAKQYEYLVLTVSPVDSLYEARRRLVEHSEYGKWELERSKLYVGGGRRFWLRRRVLQVQRTV
jgi:fibrillarin-like rRNA methylase